MKMMRADWQRFFAAYYVLNLLLISSYLFFRQRFLAVGPYVGYSTLSGKSDLQTKEYQAFPVLLAALAIKYWRKQSLDQFFSDVFFYSKTVIGVLLFYLDKRSLIAFLAVWALLFLLTSQPMYSGPSDVKEFTPITFKETVLDKPDSMVDWLVEFYAPWSPACVHLEPVMAELSLAYTSDRLKFCKVDIGRWPKLGEQFNVSPYGAAQQLPTVILFEKGKEAGRIPHVYPNGAVAKGRFRQKDIIVGFDLEKRFNKLQGSASAAAKPAKKRR